MKVTLNICTIKGIHQVSDNEKHEEGKSRVANFLFVVSYKWAAPQCYCCYCDRCQQNGNVKD